MKQLAAVAAVAVIIVVAAVHTRSAAPSVVTVSSQRLTSQSTVGKRASQQLDTMRQERGRELLEKQKALETVARQLAAAHTQAPTDVERLSQEESRRRAELQQLTQQYQTEFQTAQARFQGEIRTQLAPILADIAKRYGVDVVLNSDAAVAWSAPGTDATDEVLRRMNAGPQ
jgi:Skp family chaperone for outer membrane proteins